MSRFNLLVFILLLVFFQDPLWGAKSSKKEPPKYPKLSDKVKKAEKIDGFFLFTAKIIMYTWKSLKQCLKRFLHVH